MPLTNSNVGQIFEKCNIQKGSVMPIKVKRNVNEGKLSEDIMRGPVAGDSEARPSDSLMNRMKRRYKEREDRQKAELQRKIDEDGGDAFWGGPEDYENE